MRSATVGKPRVLGVCASPRARFKDTERAIGIISETESYQDLYSTIYELASKKRISNSEALMWMALFGAAREGADVDILLLKEVLADAGGGSDILNEDVRKTVAKADAMVLASPVYFGDCSSWMSRFLAAVSISGKVVGTVSVGAKRNGGQETNNIFTLMTALSRGGVVVGNGPPTSQYGGTGWAGDVGAILDDNFGLATSLGTGKRVAEVARQLQVECGSDARILIVSKPSANGDDPLIEEMRDAFSDVNGMEARFLNLNDHEIGPCRACSMCPVEKKEGDAYGCIIDDDMRKVDREIIGCDALGFVVDDTPENTPFWTGFKRFAERTRHLRRDHFQLADIPVFFFCKKDLTRDNLLDVKTVTYMLRQNAILFGPLITNTYQQGKLVYRNVPIPEACREMAKEGQSRKRAVEKNGMNNYSYRAVGYQGESL
jgi:multimeric flavodoxin WrbA